MIVHHWSLIVFHQCKNCWTLTIPLLSGRYSTEELSMAVATSCVSALVLGFVVGFLVARKCQCGSDNPYHVPYLNRWDNSGNYISIQTSIHDILIFLGVITKPSRSGEKVLENKMPIKYNLKGWFWTSKYLHKCMLSLENKSKIIAEIFNTMSLYIVHCILYCMLQPNYKM